MDGTPHNYYSDKQSGFITFCRVKLTVSPAIQTVHGTISIETNGQSDLPVVLLH